MRIDKVWFFFRRPPYEVSPFCMGCLVMNQSITAICSSPLETITIFPVIGDGLPLQPTGANQIFISAKWMINKATHGPSVTGPTSQARPPLNPQPEPPARTRSSSPGSRCLWGMNWKETPLKIPSMRFCCISSLGKHAELFPKQQER